MPHAILALRDLIQDHQVIVAVIVIVLLPIYSYRLWLALFASPGRSRTSVSTLRRTPPKPAVRPPVVAGGVKPPETPRSSSDQGISGYQRAGAAKTVKMPAAVPKVEGAAAPASTPSPALGERVEVKTGPGHETTAVKLPSQGETPVPGAPAGTGAAVPESKTGLIRKATRMEELGFHPGTHPGGDAAAAGTAPSGPAAGPAAGEAPRSQTAELTSILERIDKFLAEDQPAATPATPAAAPAAAPAAPATPAVPPREASAAPAAAPPGGESALTKKAPPLWARPDAQDEDVEHPPAAAPAPPADRAGERPTEKPLDQASDKPGDKPGDKPAEGSQQRLF